MKLFDRCKEFVKRVDYLKSVNQFFYLREIEPTATPVVSLKGKPVIMLGSNNYLGLSTHPRVKEAAIKAVEKLRFKPAKKYGMPTDVWVRVPLNFELNRSDL